MFCCKGAEEESGGPPTNQYATAPPRGGPPRGGGGGIIYPLFNWCSDVDFFNPAQGCNFQKVKFERCMISYSTLLQLCALLLWAGL